MKKIKAIIFASCLMSVSAFAQQIPTESFKPLGSANQVVKQTPNNIINKDSSNKDSSVIANQAVPVNNVIKVQTPIKTTTVNPSVSGTGSNVSISNNVTDMQSLSTQSNEDYMKRRNSTFESELTKCIDEIPKNARGQRSSEAMLKCANVSKAHNNIAPVAPVNNTVSNGKPSYLSDSKSDANPTTNNVQPVIKK